MREERHAAAPYAALLGHDSIHPAGLPEHDDLGHVELHPDLVPDLRRLPQRARRLQPGPRPPAAAVRRHGCPGRCARPRCSAARPRRRPAVRPRAAPAARRAPCGAPAGTGTLPHGRVRDLRRVTVASTTLSKPRNRATNSSAGCCHTSSGVPDWAIRPSRITTTRSASAKASPWSCVTASTVVPNSPNSSRSSTTSRSRSERSSWPSGSSSISSRGRGARARASATRCCSPPDSAATARRSAPGKPDELQQLPYPLGLFGPAARRASAARRRRCRPRPAAGRAGGPGTSARRPRRCAGTPRLVARRRGAPARRRAAGARPPPAAASTCRCRSAPARTRSRARRPRGRRRPAPRRPPKRTVAVLKAQQHQNSPVRSVAHPLQQQQRHRAHHHQDRRKGHRLPVVEVARAARAAGPRRPAASDCRAAR